jgi:hypothetical protein
MGLDLVGLEGLLCARKYFTKYDKCVMLGRQEFHINHQFVNQTCENNSIDYERGNDDKYIDKLLSSFGFGQVDSMDNSLFEECTIVHDMNKPVREDMKFDFVFDGGTTEHVFNTVQSIQNMIDLLNVGGILLCITPNNNFPGHGFYQFSPEIYARVMTEKYGMELLECYVAHIHTRQPQWHKVISMPDESKYADSGFVYNVAIARKISDVGSRLIDDPPNQQYYEDIAWKKNLD